MLASYFVYFCEAIAVLRGLAFAACLSTTFPGPQTLAPTDSADRFSLTDTLRTLQTRQKSLLAPTWLCGVTSPVLSLTNDRLGHLNQTSLNPTTTH